ncbi:hypothetical protein OpiT1DRAFT_02416 [Opitutaceae bacterium TAV1]|nr:hypothetical protein OpiT1DRAFT_02416 [Opitutaceae bacterium TAV1]
MIFRSRHIRLSLLASALVVASVHAAAPADSQRRIIDDFEDAGTWRQREARGQKPGAWFASDVFLGGSQKEKRHGDYVGEFRFATDPNAMPPARFGFERVKATLLTVTPDGIEFDANPAGHNAALRFTLRDARRKSFVTPPVQLSGPGWKSYRLDLGPATVPDWAQIKFPVHLQRVTLETDATGDGSVFIDDLAFTGRFSPAAQLAIRPVAPDAGRTLAHDPGKPVTLVYRASNALPSPLDATVAVRLHTAEGAFHLEKSVPLRLPARGHADAILDLGMLPVGAWQADVTLEAIASGTPLRATCDDPFGVFIPNNRRLNTRPMWLGVQDQAIWEAETERTLHLEWARQLGSDADRLAGGGGRLENRDGHWNLDGWKPILDGYRAAGIDVLFTFFELPTWMTTNPRDNRTPPKDYARFEKHAAEFGAFIEKYPSVKYVQFWNEPDSGGPGVGHGFFHGTREDYLKMFSTFSRGFRSTNRTTLLTTGGLTLADEIAGTSRGAIIDHAGDYDIAAFHAHGSLENYEGKQQKIEGWLREAGIEKRILNSETGERSGYTPAGRFRQAITLVQKIAYAKSRPSSELYLWFTLQDYWDMDAEADDSFGLVTSDNRPKPSFVAYNELIRQLANTDPVGESELAADVRALKFRRDDGSLVYVCWLQGGSTGEQLWLTVPEGRALTVTDLFGRAAPAPQFGRTAVVALGAGPVYLTTGAPGDAGELAASPPADIFLNVPSSVTVDGDNGGTLPLAFREPQSHVASGRMSLRDAGSAGADAPVWTQPFTLEAGATSPFSANIPVALATTGVLVDRLMTLDIRWQDQQLALPVRIVGAYPVRRLPAAGGNPFSSGQAEVIATLPVITLDRQSDVVEFAFDPSITPWRGPQDLSATARIAHDGRGLYFRFDVTDNKHVQVSTPSRLDRGDSVQIAIAGTGEHAGHVTTLSLGLADKGEQVIWCTRSTGPAPTGRWDTPLRIDRTGNLTRYEAWVPFDKLGIGSMQDAASPLPLRFSFIVNEDDGQRPDRWQRRVRYLRWKNGIANEADRLGHGILQP